MSSRERRSIFASDPKVYSTYSNRAMLGRPIIIVVCVIGPYGKKSNLGKRPRLVIISMWVLHPNRAIIGKVRKIELPYQSHYNSNMKFTFQNNYGHLSVIPL